MSIHKVMLQTRLLARLNMAIRALTRAEFRLAGNVDDLDDTWGSKFREIRQSADAVQNDLEGWLEIAGDHYPPERLSMLMQIWIAECLENLQWELAYLLGNDEQEIKALMERGHSWDVLEMRERQYKVLFKIKKQVDRLMTHQTKAIKYES